MNTPSSQPISLRATSTSINPLSLSPPTNYSSQINNNLNTTTPDLTLSANELVYLVMQQQQHHQQQLQLQAQLHLQQLHQLNQLSQQNVKPPSNLVFSMSPPSSSSIPLSPLSPQLLSPYSMSPTSYYYPQTAHQPNINTYSSYGSTSSTSSSNNSSATSSTSSLFSSKLNQLQQNSNTIVNMTDSRATIGQNHMNKSAQTFIANNSSQVIIPSTTSTSTNSNVSNTSSTTSTSTNQIVS